MANNDTAHPILNPYTPLAFLPPDVANQYEAVGYVYIATVSAYIWDWLLALPEEYKIFRRGRVNPANIAYLVSSNTTLYVLRRKLRAPGPCLRHLLGNA